MSAYNTVIREFGVWVQHYIEEPITDFEDGYAVRIAVEGGASKILTAAQARRLGGALYQAADAYQLQKQASQRRGDAVDPERKP